MTAGTIPQGASRRHVLKVALTSALPRPAALRLAALGSVGIAAHQPAHAEPITICLAVASAVMNMVAAANSSDGGIGGLLKATLDYQRILSSQVASLQLAMAEVLAKLNELEPKIAALFFQNRVKELQEQIGGAILSYQNIALSLGTGLSFQEWCADQNVRRTLTAIDEDLMRAAGRIEAGSYYDALTAVYLTPAVYTSLGVKAALGYSTIQLKAEAQRYLNIFSKIADENTAGSAASELKVRLAKQDELKSKLEAIGYPKSAWSSPTDAAVTVWRVVVVDYAPAPPDPRCNRPDGECTRPHVGDMNYFAFRTVLKPTPVSQKLSDEKTLNVNQLSLGPMTLERTEVPLSDANIQKPAKTVERRMEVARVDALPAAERKNVELQTTVTNFNAETAYVGVNVSALLSLEATRKGLFSFFNEGSAT